MKHLKLYENFDRYEFGDQDLSDYVNMMENIIDLTPTEISQISSALSNADILHDESISVMSDEFGTEVSIITIEFEEPNDPNEIDKTIEIFSLGDFCYCILKTGSNSGDLIKMVIVDGIDNILNKVKELIK